MAETIREFLVGIGFKVDGNSEAKFTRAVETATKAVVALGASAAAVATTVTAAVTKIAAGFDELYYASQRTKASAENIKAIGYAVSQLGGSYQGAVASLEAFTQKLRSNPGYESLAKSIGVVTRENGRLRDTTALMTDIARTLDRKYSGDKRYIALQYLEALGIDEATYEALKSGDLARYTEEYRKKQEALGVTQSRAAEIGRDLTRAWRSLSATAAALGDKLLVSLGPGIKDFVDKLDAFLLRNADRIVLFFEKVTQWVGELLKAFVQLVEKGEGPIVEMFDKIVVGVDKMKTAFEVLAVFLAGAFLVSVLGTFSKVGAGFVGMLLKLGINPLTIAGAAGATAMGYGPGAEAFRQGGYAAGAKDPDVAQTVGAAKAAQSAWETAKRAWRGRPTWLGGTGQGLNDGTIPGLSPQAQEDYANRLGHKESRNNYAQPGNQYGFRGRWQMGGPALADAGYVKRGTTNRGLEDASNWLGKDGLASLQDFLANKGGGQDKAFAAYTAINYRNLRKAGIIKDGMSEEEVAGWLAVAHLKGVGGAKQLAAGQDNFDGNGTAASSYFRMMKGLRTGAKASPAAAGAGGFDASRFDMIKDGRGIPAFDPARLARIQGNAAMGKGSFGLGGPILVPQANNATSVDMQQKTEITILGGSDPQATAQAVAGAQDKVNGGMIRNMQGAVR